jgi:aldehyde dehydrogenase (NAD+)
MNAYMDNPYYTLFLKQRQHQYVVAQATCKQRLQKLKTLQRAIEVTYRKDIQKALKKDLGKPVVESEMTEIYQIISDIKFVKKHLHRWMQKQRVGTPLSMLGSSSYFIYESKGVCLIISPWNFPFNLSFGPLISAIAAGNTAIIKPSEMTPTCSALMKTIIKDVFSEDEVALVEGEVDVASALLELPFNHIFFTGSPKVGKIVMNAAAKHLASVTLELGGKSPTIVDRTADLELAAKRIVWGKFLNSGQICVSPDYVLIDAEIKDEFVRHCKKWLELYYGDHPETSDSYGRIVTKKHFKRLHGYIHDAQQKGAQIQVGGQTSEDHNYIAPTILTELQENSKVLQEEIFGPLLPIVTYNTLEEAIEYINSKERPLALYMYSKSKKNTERLISNTRAGGTCINNSIIHYANHNLPFGGINNSGIGKSHGFYGFKAFSNERAIVKQRRFGISELLFPPYTRSKENMAKFTIKWF